jgi:Na+-driven multidrug efflux pump
MLKKIFFIGVPFAAEQLFFQGGKILTQTFVVSMGTLALDANAVCGSITGLFLIPANALAITVITVVGQCIGRRDVADARKFIKNFIIIASLSIAVVGSLSMPFYSQLISIFNPPAQVIPIIKKILYVNLAAQILMWPISFVTPSALRAAGDSRFTSVMAMLSMWLFRVVMGYVFGVLLGMGIFGIWLAMELEWGVRGLIFTTRLRGDKWYRHKLV